MGELEDTYREEALGCLKEIDKSLIKLRKGKIDKKTIFNIYRATHTLKSSSFQMGFYSIGYIAHLMSSLLKEVSAGNEKMNNEKILFLEDFYGSLKKSFEYILKNKEYMLDKQFYDKINRIIKVDEERKITEKEFELAQKIRESDELKGIYIKSSKKIIKDIGNDLEKIKKNKYDFTALKRIYENSHKIKGDSLQAGQFFISYLADIIHDYCGKILDGEKKLNDLDLMEIYDFFHTLKKHFSSIETGKNFFDEKMVKDIEERVKKKSLELEKKLNIAIEKARKNGNK